MTTFFVFSFGIVSQLCYWEFEALLYNCFALLSNAASPALLYLDSNTAEQNLVALLFTSLFMRKWVLLGLEIQVYRSKEIIEGGGIG